MKLHKSMAARTLGLAAAMVLASALVPEPAYAEEAVSGADILIPKMGEFIPALIGFVVIFVVLSKFAWPRVLSSLEAREDKIAGDIAAAEAARAEANEQLEAYKAKLAGAQSDADAILDEARSLAAAAKARIVDDANKQASDIIARGREVVESERRAAMVDLTDSIANISVSAASKIIDKNLDTASQRKLVEKYLDEVGGFNAR